MKELRHIRRSRERRAARRAARAAWWRGQEPVDSYARRLLADWGAHLMRDEILDAAAPLRDYAYSMHRDYVRKDIGLVP